MIGPSGPIFLTKYYFDCTIVLCRTNGNGKMTTNAFIFSWDQYGIESIVPITEYEDHDKQNLMRMLKDEKPKRNPLNNIVQHLMFRARFNPQRHYEIYAVDCHPDLDEKFWIKQWKEYPQETAEIIRDRGHKLYSDRRTNNREILIT